jgi:hypothetical protein
MRADAAMDWRALQYNAGLLLHEGNPGTRVLTIVFYHCAGEGGIRKQRVDLDFYEEPSLLGLTYWSVGLGDLEAEPYAEQENRVPTQWVWLGLGVLDAAAAGDAGGAAAAAGRKDPAVRAG